VAAAEVLLADAFEEGAFPGSADPVGEVGVGASAVGDGVAEVAAPVVDVGLGGLLPICGEGFTPSMNTSGFMILLISVAIPWTIGKA